MKRFIISALLVAPALAFGSPTVLMDTGVDNNTDAPLFGHRIRPCEWWSYGPGGSYVCTGYPQQRFVADADSFAAAIRNLEARIRQLEDDVARLQE